MFKLWRFMRPYRQASINALFLMLGELVVELWHPLLMAKVINEGIVPRDASAILRWGGLMAVVALGGFAAGIINSYYSSHVSQGVGYDIRAELFEKVQAFSLEKFGKFETSSLITRMTNDITQIQNLVFMSLRIMLRAPLMMIGGVILVYTIDPGLAMILVVVTPLLLVLLVWLMNRGFHLFRTVQDKLDRTNNVLRENLIGMRLIKAFVRFGHEIGRFRAVSGELRDRTTTALRFMELGVPLLLLVMNASLIVILWFGGGRMTGSGDNAGELVAIVNYTTRITASFTVISWIVSVMARARASAIRAAEVLETEVEPGGEPEADPTLSVTRGEVRFDDVGFRYPGADAPLLTGISFTARAGSTVALLGVTGAGKSSLFQLIPRLYDATEGRVMVDGHDVRAMTLDALRSGIGYVPQEAILFTGTVKDNLLWGKEDATMEEMVQAAKAAQIHDTIDRLPLKYDTRLGQQGVNLSGGQKQRLSIARALVRKPRILLFDDSTSALDAKTEARLLAALKQYPCTILMISQKISTAMNADRILILDEGRLLAQGSHAELLRQSPLYRRMLESQSGKELA